MIKKIDGKYVVLFLCGIIKASWGINKTNKKHMKKILLTIFIGAVIFAVSGIVSASMLIPAADQAKERAKAPENSPVITETGAGEWDLERVDFIHYAKPVNSGKPTRTDTCYKLMGMKWTALPVNYIINPNNLQGLDQNFIISAISTSAETWDAATSAELFNNTYTIDNAVQYGVQDYKNAIAFGNYTDANVIAVTSVWYTRVGKKIVEFDMLLDTDFVWGDATIDVTVMDLQNIVTHELGHAVGLNDVYSTSCSYVTMYGYSDNGDVAKRSLEQPDITGLRKMYGI